MSIVGPAHNLLPVREVLIGLWATNLIDMMTGNRIINKEWLVLFFSLLMDFIVIVSGKNKNFDIV